MKLLLIEDDKFHADYLTKAVQEALPEVTEIIHALDGYEGEAEARRLAAQFVVMDLQMKGRNGIDAARTIWAERPQTRILFWSNYSDEAYMRGIARIVPQDSSYGYVLKTATRERLHLALRAVLLEAQILVDQQIYKVQRQTQTHDTLTDSEYSVLIDMSLGLSDKLIAKRQGMSLRTVQNRLLSLYDKLGVDSLETAPGNIAINKRTRAITRALNLRAINPESLESAERDLQKWLHRSRSHERTEIQDTETG
ncbi:response regulator transcription factor [Roseibium algae]|uniref:Response regulator transcription factor n=1 Tax=Roseibium algae TaxID=3123038 RepID=A0ABU8TN73_9HYPH